MSVIGEQALQIAAQRKHIAQLEARLREMAEARTAQEMKSGTD